MVTIIPTNSVTNWLSNLDWSFVESKKQVGNLVTRNISAFCL